MTFSGGKKSELWTLSNVLEIKTVNSQKSRFNSTVFVLTCAAGKCAMRKITTLDVY